VKIRYLAVAREEIRDAADYYAAISPGFGTNTVSPGTGGSDWRR
jgi:hypothetical protein